MFNIFRKDIDWGGRAISLETAKLPVRLMVVFWPLWATTVLPLLRPKSTPGSGFLSAYR